MKEKLNLDGLRKENPKKIGEIERREFLKLGFVITGLFAGGTILSLVSDVNSVFATPEDFVQNYPYKPHYGMVIRQSLCIDCERCINACSKTNHVPSYGFRTRILQKTVPDAIGRKREFIPVLCNQCNNPPCVRACPTRASYKDRDNGIVRIEYKKCIGCKACMIACPYNARYFNEEMHAVDKCNFCYDTRLSQGESLTACAAACPTGARTFGDISDTESDVYRMIHQIEKTVWVIRPETGTEPNVFYMKM